MELVSSKKVFWVTETRKALILRLIRKEDFEDITFRGKSARKLFYDFE